MAEHSERAPGYSLYVSDEMALQSVVALSSRNGVEGLPCLETVLRGALSKFQQGQC